MKCIHCNASNPSTAVICESCGKPLDTPRQGHVRETTLEQATTPAPAPSRITVLEEELVHKTPRLTEFDEPMRPLPPLRSAAPTQLGKPQAPVLLPPNRAERPADDESRLRPSPRNVVFDEGVQPMVGWLFTRKFNVLGTIYPLRHGRNRIGKKRGSDVELFADAKVDDHHATILVRDEQVHVHDEGSTRGTRLNGSPIALNVWAPIAQGDELGIGDGTYVVCMLPQLWWGQAVG